jgi:hypothetical protein
MPYASQYKEAIIFFQTVDWSLKYMMHSDFIQYSIKQFLFRSNSPYRAHSIITSGFWSIVSKRGTHFEQKILMPPNDLTRSINICAMSTNSRNFTLQSFTKFLWLIHVFGVTTSFGLSEVQHDVCLYGLV